MKAVKNSLIAVLIGVAVLFIFTSGFKAFTSEGLRRLSIKENPVVLHHIQLTSSEGEVFYISDHKGKIVLVDFIFTNCNGICPTLTQNFLELQKELQKTSLKDLVMLLTVSFDPKRDTQQKLLNYAEAVSADSILWKFANVTDQNKLAELLDVFGIVVIPGLDGQFEHNGAIHLVDQSGMLAKIYDYGAIEQVLYDLKERQQDV